jgi:putative flavoprotein involved in K+ transport
MPTLDAVIVGAGAAGIGCGVVLRDLGMSDFMLLDREVVGASFERWPAEMRFITPSFPGNAFGLMDLNAVALGTSPAYSLKCEHPTGPEYAGYLRLVAQHFQLPVSTGVDVQSVEPLADEQGFLLHTSRGQLCSRFVIWAAGEYQYPRHDPFPGAEHGIHSGCIRAWSGLDGDEMLVVGGYESGMDAAINLCALGKRVRVFDGAPTWESTSGDPSLSLSPYTQERLKATLATSQLELVFDTPIVRIERCDDGYAIVGGHGERFPTAHPPILATGFAGSARLIAELFEWNAHGDMLLTAHDESTRTPGLFVAGPVVRHPGAIFCFIYKFRQRFAVIAQQVGLRLGLDTATLDSYRKNHMFLEDLSCCDDACAC